MTLIARVAAAPARSLSTTSRHCGSPTGRFATHARRRTTIHRRTRFRRRRSRSGSRTSTKGQRAVLTVGVKMTAWSPSPICSTALMLAAHLAGARSAKYTVGKGVDTRAVRPTVHFPGGQSASEASHTTAGCVSVGASVLVPVDTGVLSVLPQLWKPGPCTWHLNPLTIFVELAAQAVSWTTCGTTTLAATGTATSTTLLMNGKGLHTTRPT